MSQSLQIFTNEALSTSGKILVAIKASWCGPCKVLTPILEEMSAEGYQVFAVDADEDNLTVAKYGVRAVPTLIVFENGKEIQRFTGVKQKSELVELLK